MPDLFLGVYRYGMNKISPSSRYSENNFNTSADTALSDTNIESNNMASNPEPAQLKSEGELRCDKCGRSEVPISIQYQSQEPVNTTRRENTDSKGLKKELDGLKNRMDYFDIRFGCIEKALFSKND